MFRIAVLVLLVAVAWPGDVAAQEVPRIFRGLFRPSDTPDTSRHRVDLRADIYGTYATSDLDLQPVTDAFDLRLYEAMVFGTTPLLQYVFNGDRRVFGAVAAGSFWRYNDIDWRAARYYTHMRFATPTGPRTNVSLRWMASYTPFYTLDLSVDPEREGTELLPTDDALPLAERSTMFYDVSAQLRHRMSVRSEIAVNGGFAYTDYSSPGFDTMTPSASFRYSRQMTEHLRLQAGYGYRQWNYPDDAAALPTVRTHDIISGISYTRPLPFSRRTQVGFDLGSAVAQTPNAWRYDINGGAFVAHPFGRGWGVVGSYRRGLDARAGLSAPLYLIGNTAAVTLGGLVARRFGVYTTGTYVSGESLFDEFSERNEWWSASTSVSTLLFSAAAAYLTVGWSGQRFTEQVGFVTGLPRSLDQFSVSGGLSLGLPLVR